MFVSKFFIVPDWTRRNLDFYETDIFLYNVSHELKVSNQNKLHVFLQVLLRNSLFIQDIFDDITAYSSFTILSPPL